VKYRRHHTFITKIILWGSLLSIAYLSQQTLIKVEDVKCSLPNNQACPSYITDELSKLKGESLLFNTFEDSTSKLQFTQPVQIKIKQKSLPKTLFIEASIDPGLYRIQNTNLITTAEGVTFTNDNSELPEVELTSEDLGSDENISSDHQILVANYHQGLKTIFESFQQQELSIKKIRWESDQTIKIELDTDLIVITDVNTIHTSAQKTSLILKAKINEGLEWNKKELDVRFRLPVLRNRT